jgi:hypothetical protein
MSSSKLKNVALVLLAVLWGTGLYAGGQKTKSQAPSVPAG